MNRLGGYSRNHAAHVMSSIEQVTPGPYRLLAYGRPTDGPESHRTCVSTLPHPSLGDLYQAFRRFRPVGRFAITVEDADGNLLLLDTQLLGKAYFAPSWG